MGVRERKREKAKDEEKSSLEKEVRQPEAADDTERMEVRSEGIHTPEVVLKQPETHKAVDSSESAIETADKPTIEVLEPHHPIPPWGGVEESEWMYGTPTRETDMKLWAEEWGDYLLQWAEANAVHVLSIATFISEPPFKDMRSKVDAFRTISEHLIQKDVAEWVDKNERQLRIYWKPLEDWADEIYGWCLEKGKLRLDVKSVVIQEGKEDFARLPEEDLHKVMAIMVSKGLAQWVEKKRGAIIIQA